ncbi:MAG: transposase [bacterium]|nr:transposase [bacterium]
MLAERVKEWTMEWKEEGLQQGLQQGLCQGLESEQRMLARQVKRRYGPGMAETISPLLQGIRELRLLEAVGEWVIEYDDGQVFFNKLKEVAGR